MRTTFATGIISAAAVAFPAMAQMSGPAMQGPPTQGMSQGANAPAMQRATTNPAPELTPSMPLDTPFDLGSVTAVCTGVGSAQDDPRWDSYPVRVVFSNGGAQFVSGTHVELMTAANAKMESIDCAAPWLLLKLPAGSYKVNAWLTGQSGAASMHSASFTTTGKGEQKRVEIQFPAVASNK